MSASIKRATASGDKKYLILGDVFKSFESGKITKERAIEILGPSYKNTVRMWAK